MTTRPFPTGPVPDTLLKRLTALSDLYRDGEVKPSAIGLEPGEFDALIDMVLAAPKMLELLRDAVDYIEMRTAHSGSMSVEQILSALEGVRKNSSITIAHHVGCSKTSRAFNLSTARAITGQPGTTL